MNELRCSRPNCGKTLTPPAERHYAEVTGLERPGRGINNRSGSSLVLRHRTGNLVCQECVTRELVGITQNQMALT